METTAHPRNTYLEIYVLLMVVTLVQYLTQMQLLIYNACMHDSSIFFHHV